MITVAQYFHDSMSNYGFEPTAEDLANATDLLDKVNGLYPDAQLRSGHRVRAKTLALIASGHKAAVGGTHEHSNGVDIADPDNEHDVALDDEILEAHGLYREHPMATDGWVHLQRVPPRSGHRTFYP
jgi:hypothetical protein